MCTLILAAASLAPSALLAQARERTECHVAERARPGDRSAPIEALAVHVVADVIATGPGTRTVELRGATRDVDLRVHDAAQFKLVAVGDQVEATYAEAVAVSVEPVGVPE